MQSGLTLIAKISILTSRKKLEKSKLGQFVLFWKHGLSCKALHMFVAVG